MRARSNTVLLLELVAFLASNAIGARYPVQRELELSIDDLNSILRTEVQTEYNQHRLLNEHADSLWKASINYEWSRARELEARTLKNARGLRRTTATNTTFPYLVCDTERGKPGEECRNKVIKHFGEPIMPIYNQIDKTCYIVSSLASIAEASPDTMQVSPVVPEMKMQHGMVDNISSSTTIPLHFDATFCPGETKTATQGANKVDEVFSRIGEQDQNHGRYLVTDNFLRIDAEVETRDEQRTAFWSRTLQEDIDSSLCRDVFDTTEIDVAPNGKTFSFQMSTPEVNENFRSCLLLLVTGMATQPEICWIGVVPGVKPLNSEAQWLTQSRKRKSLPFFDVGLDGQGEVISIGDTGLDTDNCYFWDATGEVDRDGSVDLTRRKIVQYVPVGDQSDDVKGHGTHVVGTAVGRRAVDGTSESTGEVDGIARAAKVAFIDLGVSGQDTLKIPAQPTILFEHGLKADSNIHSISWGTDWNGYHTNERYLDAFSVDHPEWLAIIASGNSGATPNTVGSPATCKNGLTVGSSHNAVPHTSQGMRGPDFLAYFSSSGPTEDGRMKPEIIAPGYYIKSAEARPEKKGECDDGNDRNGAMYSAGTSMSAPVVAGAAALIRQYFREGWHPRGSRGTSESMNPTSSLVKAVLINGGQRLVGVQYYNESTAPLEECDVYQGYGGISLIHSLPLHGNNDLKARFVDRKPISNGQEHTYDITVDTTSKCDAPLSATLVWTDPPGVPGCTLCVLNDLDLSITKAGQSTQYYPNGKTSPDSINNAERIRIEDAKHGDKFVVHVKGSNLESSSQDYSLVMTGCFDEISATSSEQKDCVDGDKKFIVNMDVGMETCSWLEGNMDEYDYLCLFADVAKTCPVTCDFCHVVRETPKDKKSLGTAMAGNIQWYGNMFNVEAKETLTVNSLSIHTASTDALHVAVFTKPGSFDSKDVGWIQVANTTIQGKGFRNPTPIPSSAFSPVQVDGLQAFYVTSVGTKNIIMTREKKGKLYDTSFEDGDISIQTGYAVTSLFGRNYSPFSWNGEIHYSIGRNTGEWTCADSNENIHINDIGDRSCEWVSENPSRFGFLCDLAEIAAACPVTCNFCDKIEA